MLETQAPLEITKIIQKFCKSITPHTPVFVDVRPVKEAAPNNCFFNVEDKIKKDGGKIIHGWQIWEWPKVLIEAEFHAIWESPVG